MACFTDQENDPESGLMYYGARYYDPWVGRFLSQDPALIGPFNGATFAQIGGNPQHFNAYSYALNAPTVYTDPTGRVPHPSELFSYPENVPRPTRGGSDSKGGESGGGSGSKPKDTRNASGGPEPTSNGDSPAGAATGAPKNQVAGGNRLTNFQALEHAIATGNEGEMWRAGAFGNATDAELTQGAMDVAAGVAVDAANIALTVGGLRAGGPVLEAAPLAGRAALSAGEQVLGRAFIASQNAGFGSGVVSGIGSAFTGGPTPYILGNGKFNAGAKFGNTLGKFGKTVWDGF